VKVVSSIKHIPRSPRFIKALEHTHRRERTNLDLFENSLPRGLGIQDEFVPNVVFDPSFMALLVVKNLVVAFNPNGQKINAPKEVPNFNHLGTILLGKPFPEENLFPIETIIITQPHPTKFVHDVSGPPPRSLSLDAIPKLMLD
jgi:hypothetical protein